MSYHTPFAPVTANPITWQQVKYWCKLDDDIERDGLMALSDDMLAWAETKTSSTLVRRTRTVIHYSPGDSHECGRRYEVPYGPVASITSVRDDNGDDVEYELQRAGTACYVLPISSVPAWPLTITYVAGEAALPSDVRRAVLMAVEMTHRNRGADVDLSGVERILQGYCQTTGAA